ncbi:MAG: DUF934 domain-containing protein [Gammaproteobacteria bacterium]|nr:DUF934 domain-containing protein [Gammaproteobacteria bacterium]
MPSRVLKDRRVVADAWRRIGDDAEVPPEGDVLVSWRRWCECAQALRQRAGRIGVWLEAGDDVGALAAHLAELDLVALNFATFGDGRAFSQARLLREACGYRGELRAIGEVLRDQLYFMARCGFDSFELRSDKDAEDALAAFTEFSVSYQPAADDAPPIWRLRG